MDWLLPALDVGRYEVLNDRRCFLADDSVYRQMDESQDQAERQIFVFSKDYLASAACLHELNRACSQDRVKQTGIKLDDCAIPSPFGDRLYIDFSRDLFQQEQGWALFDRTIPLGLEQPYKWLDARLKVKRALERRDSVNLVENDDSYKKLLDQIQPNWQASQNTVDLSRGRMYTHEGVVKCLLEASGLTPNARISPQNWLVVLDESFTRIPK